IYQGIRQEVGPIKLSEVYELSDVAISELPTFAQSRVAEGITAPSLTEARTILGELEAEAH
ncbi:MAG TPA: serine/threonine-protein phosphatase, partial [Beutenbergiaceae bacterium]|nr:serine/threonine-protein phosphatase [Beutenbergiaceae bacterium]